MPERIRVHLLRSPDDRPNHQLQWTDPGTGRRRTRSAKTPDDALAEQRRADLEYELNNGVAAASAEAGLSWHDFRRRYEAEYLAGKRAATRSKARHVFAEFEASASPDTLRGIGEHHLSQYVGSLRRRGLDPTTVRGYLVQLRGAFSWAVRQKLITSAPHIELPAVPRRKRRRKTIDADGYRRLRAALSPPWTLLLDVAWFTGMRLGELRSLSWEESDDAPWLDLKGGRIYFAAASQKSDEADWIPVHGKLATILRKLPGRTGKVIPGLPAAISTTSEAFKRACVRAGFDITAHCLRHSFGTRYAVKVRAQTLQRLMRHASIQTTLEFYVDLDHSLRDAIMLD